MNRNRFLIAFLIALAFFFEMTRGAMAQPGANSRGSAVTDNNEISINFDNAPIIDVIDIMSKVTGKTFIIDRAVTGNVTVISPQRVPRSEAFGIFESILEMNGFSLVPTGSVIKIVPSRTATQKSIPFGKGRELPEGTMREQDQMITQLIPIRHADAQEITTVLTPLISRDANLTTYANTNMIILTETASNIDRLLKIVREIDIPGFEEKITIIPLVNATASELADEIMQALESSPAAPGIPATRTRRRTTPQQALAAATASQIKIIPVERTNSLIVVATEADTEQVQYLVQELDKATPVEANNIHVFRPKNVLAEDIEAVLTKMGTTVQSATSQQGGAVAPGGVTPIFHKIYSVVSDPKTNSLIIVASPQDYAVLQSVMEQLDIMRPQVLVETLIAEVSLDFTRSLGVSWQVGIPDDHDSVGYAAVNPILTTVPDLSGDGETTIDLNTLTGDLLTNGLSVGYVNIDAGSFLRALVQLNADETNTDFNVLSAPHVLTLDNEKATINVSDNVPFITSRLTDTGGTTDLAQSETFEYRDVGIILEITPHISPDRNVRLEIVQKVNEVSVVSSGISAGALSEKKREAQTTVMVKDHQTLVLGGLMKDSDNDTVTQVPFLGDIPILGWAFKQKTTTKGKTNLLLFITPSIITSSDEAAEITMKKKNEVGEELREQMEGSPTMQKIMPSEPESSDSTDVGGDEQIEDLLYETGPK